MSSPETRLFRCRSLTCLFSKKTSASSIKMIAPQSAPRWNHSPRMSSICRSSVPISATVRRNNGRRVYLATHSELCISLIVLQCASAIYLPTVYVLPVPGGPSEDNQQLSRYNDMEWITMKKEYLSFSFPLDEVCSPCSLTPRVLLSECFDYILVRVVQYQSTHRVTLSRWPNDRLYILDVESHYSLVSVSANRLKKVNYFSAFSQEQIRSYAWEARSSDAELGSLALSDLCF